MNIHEKFSIAGSMTSLYCLCAIYPSAMDAGRVPVIFCTIMILAASFTLVSSVDSAIKSWRKK